MNRIYLLLVGLLTCLYVGAEDKLTLSTAGNSISIGLDNETSFTAFQMDVVIPQGLTKTAVTPASRIASSLFEVDSEMIESNVLRVIAYNTDNQAIDGNTGELVNIALSSTLKTTDIVEVRNIRFVKSNNLSEMLLGDVSTKIEAPTNPSEPDNDNMDADVPDNLATALYATDTEGCANGSFALPIELKSEFTVKAFEFDVTLPEGMSFASANGGSYLCSRTDRIGNGYTITCNTLAGHAANTSHVICSNMSNPNDAITGTEGSVLTITINIANTVAQGDYKIAVSGITLVKNSGEEYTELFDKTFKSNVSVIEFILGDANNSGKVNVADITAVVSHIYGQTSENFNRYAADVNASGTINVADITGIVSIIYGGSANARSAAQIHNEEVMLSMPSVVAEQGTEVNVPIHINNVDAVSAYQFDLTLPKGVEVKDVHSTSNAHQCLGAYMEDGTYRIMSYSMTNETFINPAVPVGYVTLNVSHDATVGTYDMPLSAATSTANGKENSTHVANGRLIVGNATGINSIDNNGTHADTITTLGGVRMNPTANLPKGIYIMNGKKQIIK